MSPFPINPIIHTLYMVVRIPVIIGTPRPAQRRAQTRHQQIPALAQKLQSSLIMLGPRKDAVRRPQHGYNVYVYKKEGYVVAQ